VVEEPEDEKTDWAAAGVWFSTGADSVAEGLLSVEGGN
jgi:hypothetical protein